MNNRGITLMEIVAVLTVIGVMSAYATPRLLSTREGLAVRAAADEFVAAHTFARATAIRQGRVVRLKIDAASGRFWIETDSSPTKSGVMVRLAPVRSISSKNVTMTSSRDVLCFDGRGITTPIWSCPSGDAVLTFTRGEYADTVTTTITGKVLR
jgi:prepilin-type N-terminal cleavage/methylation domain-containing protein